MKKLELSFEDPQHLILFGTETRKDTIMRVIQVLDYVLTIDQDDIC